jgi:hypothetical protein
VSGSLGPFGLAYSGVGLLARPTSCLSRVASRELLIVGRASAHADDDDGVGRVRWRHSTVRRDMDGVCP